MNYSVQTIYDEARRWFAIIPPLVTPVLLIVNAPFGRFAPLKDSIFLLDGIKTWIAMEIVSPLAFAYTYLHSPLSGSSSGFRLPVSLLSPQNVLASLFLIHYLNRALISPLRTPSRSKSHIIVPFCAVIFNTFNGSLNGTYLSSPTAVEFLSTSYGRPTFWLGVSLWGIGFIGNVVHDEILFNIRRKANAKGKAKDTADKKGQKEHYTIPHGLFYEYVSYPNYFFEWVEWLGFAMASSCFPDVSSLSAFFASVPPPYLFVLSEIFLMAPRALRGHEWYRQHFPHYPKNRKAVIPFIL